MGKYSVGVASFILGLIVMGFYLGSSSDEPEVTIQIEEEEIFSVKEEAAKAKEVVTGGSMAANVLFASEVLHEKDEEKVDQLRKKYYEKFDTDSQEVANRLEVLEKEHYELISEMIKRKVKIDPVTNLKPRFALTVAYYLDLKVSELKPDDLQNLQLSSREWYLLKTFSESNNFKIMLKRGELTSEYVQLDNLASMY